MFESSGSRIRLTIVSAGAAALAACATPAPPPPVAVVVPPPAPVVKYVPPRPTPPNGATTGMFIPAADEYGIRRTVNYGLTTSQTVWNLRAALNVAALNCLNPEHAEILPAYSLLLERNGRLLARTNSAIEGEFRTNYGSVWRDSFDDYMTQVYNYYALPPTQGEFCDTALAISREYMLTDGTALDTFALANLPRIEQVFQRFYAAYNQYQLNVAAWDAEYAPPPPVLVNTFNYAENGAIGGDPGATSTPIYTVDVMPSTAVAGPAPVIVSQLPSDTGTSVYAPAASYGPEAEVEGAAEGYAVQAVDPSYPQSPPETTTAIPGFSITAAQPTNSAGAPIVFESGEIVQSVPEPDQGQ